MCATSERSEHPPNIVFIRSLSKDVLIRLQARHMDDGIRTEHHSFGFRGDRKSFATSVKFHGFAGIFKGFFREATFSCLEVVSGGA